MGRLPLLRRGVTILVGHMSWVEGGVMLWGWPEQRVRRWGECEGCVFWEADCMDCLVCGWLFLICVGCYLWTVDVPVFRFLGADSLSFSSFVLALFPAPGSLKVATNISRTVVSRLFSLWHENVNIFTSHSEYPAYQCTSAA